jgi:alkylation response protein AidB-like acyl-CoA dehydrogenase
VGPSIIGHGSDDQKAYFLPHIISGEDRYCQGFSEPDFGSDLAGARTRGTVKGDEIVISGHKIWTSYAGRANRIFILCRTDPDAPKHRGLSYVIADFSPSNGIDARPIRDMAGGREFHEEFIDGARAPLFNVIGGLNNGWRVAMTTLGNERSGRATAQQLARERELNDLIETARQQGRTGEPAVRQQLAWAHTQVQLLRFGRLRMLTDDGDRVAAIWKLAWTEYHARFGEIALDILGPSATLRPEGCGYTTDRWQDVFLASRSGTISGGTSEIQRNLLAERVLGLPRDPSPA